MHNKTASSHLIPRTVRQEILYVIIVKVLFLYGLWWLCFSHPPEKKQMTALAAAHLFTPSHTGAPDADQS